MSITTEISRIQSAATTIKNKISSFGLTTTSDTIDVQASAIDAIQKNPPISEAITTPSGSLTIPAGYYDGSTAVSANVPVNYYITGTNTPESSTGDDGDLYLVVKS